MTKGDLIAALTPLWLLSPLAFFWAVAAIARALEDD